MALRNDSHIEPEKNLDLAEAERDPLQLTAEGKHGAAYDLYTVTEEVQIGGDRNDRVTEFNVNDHNTESRMPPRPTLTRRARQRADRVSATIHSARN